MKSIKSGNRKLNENKVYVYTMRKDDIPFLIDLWYKMDVMKYSDELPSLRGWTKTTDKEEAWSKYEEKRIIYGNDYSQLIIKLKGQTKIGESFYAPIKSENELYGWKKPKGRKVLIGDIKISPEYWNKGMENEIIQKVLKFTFQNTDLDMFITFPHKKNRYAVKIFKEGRLKKLKDRDNNRLVMMIDRERYEKLYRESYRSHH